VDDDLPALESPLTPPGADEDNGVAGYAASDYFQPHGIIYNVDQTGVSVMFDHSVSAHSLMQQTTMETLEQNVEQSGDKAVEKIDTE